MRLQIKTRQWIQHQQTAFTILTVASKCIPQPPMLDLSHLMGFPSEAVVKNPGAGVVKNLPANTGHSGNVG